MTKKIYAMISITFILLIINISLSLYISSREEYEDNYLSYYFKFKNIPTIIPFDFEEPLYEYEYIDENFFSNYMHEEVDSTINNQYNNSNKALSYCYSLLNKFIYCLSNNVNNSKCEKLFIEKINELEKCEILNANNSIQDIKNNIVYFNFPNNDLNADIEAEFENEKIFNEINDISIKEKQIKKYEYIPQKINQIALPSPKKKETLDYYKKDCVEYGLKDEYIICTKYE